MSHSMGLALHFTVRGQSARTIADLVHGSSCTPARCIQIPLRAILRRLAPYHPHPHGLA